MSRTPQTETMHAVRALFPALVSILLMIGCTGERPDADLPPLPIPVKIDELDPPVRAQYDERREALDRLLARRGAEHGELADAYGTVGMWHHAYRDLELARLAYRHAEALAPDEPRWRYYLGVLAAALGDVELARESLGGFLEARPRYSAALIRLAELELEAGHGDAARPLFADALAEHPESVRALTGLGRLALQERDFDAAAAHLSAAAELQPDSANIHYSLGLAYRGLGEIELATRHMSRADADNRDKQGAIVVDPLMVDVTDLVRGVHSVGERGRKAYEAGQIDEAIAAAREAIATDPDRPELHLNLGAALLRTGRVEEAMAAFQETLRLEPSHPVAHFSLGTILVKLDRKHAAERHLRAATVANPGYKEAHFNLANLLRRQGDWAAALVEYRRVAELDPGLAQARLLTVVSLAELDRSVEAGAALERALADLPRAPGLRVLQARLAATAGDVRVRDGHRALAMASKLFEAAPALAAAEAVAAAHAEIGDFQQALAWQKAALAATDRVAGQDAAAARVERRLALYRDGRACREIWADDELKGFSLRVDPPIEG